MALATTNMLDLLPLVQIFWQKGLKGVEKFVKNNSNKTRLAVSVPRKVSQKAVLRNKIKRRLISLAEKILPGVKEETDLFLLALPGIEKKSFNELGEMIKKIFKAIEHD